MWQDLQAALVITRREIRDQFRDWRIIAPIIILTIFFPGLMNFTAQRAVSFVQTYGAEIIGDRLIPFLLMVVGFFPISVSLVIALESFVGEKERRSIEPLLSTPLTDEQLYLGKLMAVIFPPLIASYLGITVYLIGVYRQVGWQPNLTLLIQVLALATVQTLVMVSGAVVVSSQTTSVRAANLLASFIIIPMALLLVGESMIMFWARYNILWWVIFGQAVIAGLLIRTGIAHFNREELLGRELDTLNVSWAWRTFWSAFLGGYQTLRTWWNVQVGGTLRGLRIPILISLALTVAGSLFGAHQAGVYRIPPEYVNWGDLDRGMVAALQEVGPIRFFSVQGVGVVFLHNLRVIGLASILGIFSFGVLGMIVLLLPFGIIGFLASTAARTGFSPWQFLGAFVLPHGLLEIPAIIISGALILRLGVTMVTPAPDSSIGEAWLRSLAEWTRIMLVVVVPLLFGAAVIEVFLTPQIALWFFNY